MSPRHPGRTRAITEQHVRDVEQARRLGMSMTLTAAYIGVDRSTLFEWQAKGRAESRAAGGLYIALADALKRGTAKGAALSLGRIQKAAQGGVWQADAWLLERVHGYRAGGPTPDEADEGKEQIANSQSPATTSSDDARAIIIAALQQAPELIVEVLRADPSLLSAVQSAVKEGN